MTEAWGGKSEGSRGQHKMRTEAIDKDLKAVQSICSSTNVIAITVVAMRCAKFLLGGRRTAVSAIYEGWRGPSLIDDRTSGSLAFGVRRGHCGSTLLFALF